MGDLGFFEHIDELKGKHYDLIILDASAGPHMGGGLTIHDMRDPKH